jgi:hypothetical protein
MNWCEFIDQTHDLSQKRDKVKEILLKNVGEMWENSAKCGKCGNVGGLYSLLLINLVQFHKRIFLKLAELE